MPTNEINKVENKEKTTLEKYSINAFLFKVLFEGKTIIDLTTKLVQETEHMHDAILDLRCRSMRNDIVIHWINDIKNRKTRLPKS